jgi:benzodiazapine receptor
MWLLVAKPTQLVAVTTLWRAAEGDTKWAAAALYCLHLALGDAWNKLFFGQRRIAAGTLVISLFAGTLAATAAAFWAIAPRAGMWMLPTCGWVAVATALNWNIYLNNPETRE